MDTMKILEIMAEAFYEFEIMSAENAFSMLFDRVVKLTKPMRGVLYSDLSRPLLCYGEWDKRGQERIQNVLKKTQQTRHAEICHFCRNDRLYQAGAWREVGSFICLPLVNNEFQEVLAVIYLEASKQEYFTDFLRVLDILFCFWGHIYLARCVPQNYSKKIEEDFATLRYGIEQTRGYRSGEQKIVGTYPEMVDVYINIERFKDEKVVLIQGETGTGKELVAKALHYRSERSHAKKEMGIIDCTACSKDENSLISLLYGHKKGAYSGAIADRAGVLKQYDGGVVFIDEVASISDAMQKKLLRTIEHGDIFPLGADKPGKVDVQFVIATHTSLRILAGEGKFRKDLYYRLARYIINIPPLRNRGFSDMNQIIDSILSLLNRTKGRNIKIANDARWRLYGYSWPGNIRELQNIIACAYMEVSSHSKIITEREIEKAFAKITIEIDKNTETEFPRLFPRYTVEEVEKAMLRQASSSGLNKKKSSNLLGYRGKNTIQRKLKKYGINWGEDALDIP